MKKSSVSKASRERFERWETEQANNRKKQAEQPSIQTIENADGSTYVQILTWEKPGLILYKTATGSRVELSGELAAKHKLLSGLTPQRGASSKREQERELIASQAGRALTQAFDTLGRVHGIPLSEFIDGAREHLLQGIGESLLALGEDFSRLIDADETKRQGARERLKFALRAVVDHLARNRRPLAPSDMESGKFICGKPREIFLINKVIELVMEHERLPDKKQLHIASELELKATAWSDLLKSAGLKSLPDAPPWSHSPKG